MLCIRLMSHNRRNECKALSQFFFQSHQFGYWILSEWSASKISYSQGVNHNSVSQ